jgi:thiol-disulfide isomerase/thioredoxin
MVKLEQFRGKYVLIDFWASWCPPCRAANPELLKLYEQFAQRGFTIVGISVDDDSISWRSAIETDRLPWVNLSNLNGWDELTEIYGVKAVPQNFLLDTNGIIIEKNIDPGHLAARLEELLVP